MNDSKKKVQEQFCSNCIIRLSLFVFLLFPSILLFGQESKAPKTKALAIEKVYLHLDRSFYTAGEDIWFKAYLMDGRTHTPAILSDLVYVELIGPNNEIVSKKTLKTTTGSAAGDFKLSPESVAGIYTIRGYTNYMRNFDISNFYTKEIFVNTANPTTTSTDTTQVKNTTSLDVQFFPEGGYLINGFLNPIGFKALDNQGNSIPISGKLMDDTGNIIKEFTSSHLGMGLFHFIPKANRTYSALVSYADQEKRFVLPTALDSGVLMTVSNQPMHYKVELRGTKDVKIKDFRLLGNQNKGPVFNLTVNANKQEHTTIIKIAKDLLKEGVLELTLFNQEKQPVAERLLFHENSVNSSPLNFSMTTNTYGKRKLVKMEVTMDSWSSDTPMADLSLSVTNTAVNPSVTNTTDIKTHLLLSSVLKGEIEQPGYYFYSNAPDRQRHLDVLMRTQGWRQYELREELVKSSNYFLPEKGITLSGKVLSATNSTERLSGSVSLTANSASEMMQDRAKTAEDGRFSFNNLNFTDTTTVLLSANVYYPKKKRNPALNYKIILDTVSTPPIRSSPMNPANHHFENDGSLQSTKEKLTQFTGAYEKAQETTLSFVLNNKTIQLDEAFIAAKKKPKVLDKFEKKRLGMPYKEPSQTIDFEVFTEMGFPNLLEALRGRVPGSNVSGGYIYLRAFSSFSQTSPGAPNGLGAALILLDGSPVNVTPEGYSILEQMLPSNVDFIDILKGPRAAIYGSRAADGVIAIYTKNGTESKREIKKCSGAVNFKHLGYDYARNFYRPTYTKSKSKSDKNDSRTTLLWQPFVQLNEEGKARVSFYSGDVTGDYQATIEGITATGQVLTSTVYFVITNDNQYQ